MVSFVREQHKRSHLCLEILSYPSCILAWLRTVLILFWKTKEHWKNICLFTGICVLFGGIYLEYFTGFLSHDNNANTFRLLRLHSFH